MKMDTGLLFTFFQRVKPSACDASLSESSQVDSNQQGNVFFFIWMGPTACKVVQALAGMENLKYVGKRFKATSARKLVFHFIAFNLK